VKTAWLFGAAILLALTMPAAAQPAPDDPDARARAIEAQLTPDERIVILHGVMANARGPSFPKEAIGAAGFVPGVARLGIPALQETDASLGVAWAHGVRPGDGATPLPSSLALAATFDPEIAYAGGAMIASEARLKGFNVLLAGGANLARDPRGGRNFEYLGEDPLLAGTLAGASIRGIQDQHIVSTLKHFALNDQETGRHFASSNIGEAAARESDLLAFEVALETGHPASVMCAYNKVGGVYACENDALLDRVLKGDWRFPGWVMSDWGAVHSTGAALTGLDQQSGEQLDQAIWFGAPLKDAAARDKAYAARVADMDHRILRSLFAVGVIDHPPAPGPIDYAADEAVAQREIEQGIVLLKNRSGLLPLARSVKRVAVIGGRANAGVLSGGGSSQTAPVGGAAVQVPYKGEGTPQSLRALMYHPGAPLQAIRAELPNAEVRYDEGAYPQAAAALAAKSDVAIVFVTQWMTEGFDAHDLGLPDGQDALIAAVAAANPNTIVVLETGGPVAMPWLNKVGGVLEAWYPADRGAVAIAEVLTGRINPSGRLPVTFPADVSQTPRPVLPGWDLPEGQGFDVDYDIEGAEVGYRWFAAKGFKPLFPFGFGLGYTTFAYGGLKVEGGKTLTVSFDVTNTGGREGADAPQVYVTSGVRSAERLIGFSKVLLGPGETRRVTLTADPRLLADWDAAAHGWKIDGGAYRIAVGASAMDLKLSGEAKVEARRLEP
jgi:beta-glucosidase